MTRDTDFFQVLEQATAEPEIRTKAGALRRQVQCSLCKTRCTLYDKKYGTGSGCAAALFSFFSLVKFKTCTVLASPGWLTSLWCVSWTHIYLLSWLWVRRYKFFIRTVPASSTMPGTSKLTVDRCIWNLPIITERSTEQALVWSSEEGKEGSENEGRSGFRPTSDSGPTCSKMGGSWLRPRISLWWLPLFDPKIRGPFPWEVSSMLADYDLFLHSPFLSLIPVFPHNCDELWCS